jgi:hypothetical protein
MSTVRGAPGDTHTRFLFRSHSMPSGTSHAFTTNMRKIIMEEALARTKIFHHREETIDRATGPGHDPLFPRRSS